MMLNSAGSMLQNIFAVIYVIRTSKILIIDAHICVNYAKIVDNISPRPCA
jgi:hypothetical protein